MSAEEEENTTRVKSDEEIEYLNKDYVTTDKGKAERFLSKNYNKLRSGSMKPVKEETELEEGRMKELHTLIQQGKSAEEIAKIMKLDVKTIQSLMPKEGIDESVYLDYDTMTDAEFFKKYGVTRKDFGADDKRPGPGYTKKEDVNEVSPPGWGGSVRGSWRKREKV